MNTSLVFQNTTFHPVERDGKLWLTAVEIAKALGYSRADKVSQIYQRNASEFTSAMTDVVENPNLRFSGNLQKEVRIFSLRGAHLIGMFSRTQRAADFRKWVLDVLENHTTPTHHVNTFTGQPVVRSGNAFVPVGQAESDKYLLLNAMIQQMGFGHPPVVLPYPTVQKLFLAVRAYQGDVYMAAEWLSFIDKEIAAIKTATGRDFGENPNAAKPWPQAEDDAWEA